MGSCAQSEEHGPHRPRSLQNRLAGVSGYRPLRSALLRDMRQEHVGAVRGREQPVPPPPSALPFLALLHWAACMLCILVHLAELFLR